MKRWCARTRSRVASRPTASPRLSQLSIRQRLSHPLSSVSCQRRSDWLNAENRTAFFGELMATEVVMPQMGESIAEGTITKWLKQVGERVERDEPLFEISTDKVDAEIPSPAAGVLTEIKFKEGETVDVNTVVAVLDGDAASGNGAAAKPSAEEPRPEQTQ